MYRFHRWQANLRILHSTEIKTVAIRPVVTSVYRKIDRDSPPGVPRSVFILDATDPELKLSDFKSYYLDTAAIRLRRKELRSGRRKVPISNRLDGGNIAVGLYETPIAA